MSSLTVTYRGLILQYGESAGYPIEAMLLSAKRVTESNYIALEEETRLQCTFGILDHLPMSISNDRRHSCFSKSNNESNGED